MVPTDDIVLLNSCGVSRFSRVVGRLDKNSIFLRILDIFSPYLFHCNLTLFGRYQKVALRTKIRVSGHLKSLIRLHFFCFFRYDPNA
jgi:hypothetical protein